MVDKRIVVMSTLCCLIAAFTTPLLAAARETPGKYEFTVIADGKTHVSTYCVTPAEADAVNADEGSGRAYAEKAAKGACSVTTYQVRGETISSTLSCGEGERASKVTYHGDSFEGETTYSFPANGKRMVRVSHIKAKRVGACK